MVEQERTPNVVTEVQFKDLVEEQGFNVEVLINVDASRKAAVWYGEWVLRAVSPDGSVEKILVPARTSAGEGIRIRVFKTANGLISFLEGIGYAAVNIPLKEGHKTLLPNPRTS